MVPYTYNIYYIYVSKFLSALPEAAIWFYLSCVNNGHFVLFLSSKFLFLPLRIISPLAFLQCHNNRTAHVSEPHNGSHGEQHRCSWFGQHHHRGTPGSQ